MEKYLNFSQRHISKAEFSADTEARTVSVTVERGLKEGSSEHSRTKASCNLQQRQTSSSSSYQVQVLKTTQ